MISFLEKLINILNLLIKELRIAGLMIETIAELAIIIYGRIIIVFKYILIKVFQNILKYLFLYLIYREIIGAKILSISQIITFVDMRLNYVLFILKVILAIVSMMIINIMIFYNTE